jgi:hypothetical protein
MALLKDRWRPPRAIVIVMIALLTAAPSPVALTEAQVKAALLYNFAFFVEWPEPAGSTDAIVIGVMGNEEIAAALRATRGQATSGRLIEVRSVEESHDPRECHILFIASRNDRAISALLARIERAPVLTVGEHAEFTRMGGMIRVYPDRGQLRFEVDLARAKGARLKISSRVLNLARIVRDGNDNP